MTNNQPPGPKGLPILGIALELGRDPIGFAANVIPKYGDIVPCRLLHERLFFLRHPDYIQYVLRDNSKNFIKQTLVYKMLKPLLGTGLLLSEGTFWLRQRRIAQPSFHRERIASFAATMTEATEEMLQRWDTPAGQGTPIDVAQEMMALTFRIVTETLLSKNMSHVTSTVGRSLTLVLEDIQRRWNSFVPIPLAIPTPQNLRIRKALRDLKKSAADIIEDHHRFPGHYADLLSMLMEAKDEETGEKMNDAQLLDEVVNIMLAGYETTSNALTWTFYLLSQNPDAEQKLSDELKRVLSGRTPTVDDLAKLPYTEMVVKEAMRLYPPVWWLDRRVVEDDEIGGVRIPKNSVVILSPYMMHHHPVFWKNPEKFDPERFTPENVSRMHPFSYLPFSHGPRQCIGNNFAMMESRLVLATIAQRYRLELAPGTSVEPTPAVVLKPKGGMRVVLRGRNNEK